MKSKKKKFILRFLVLLFVCFYTINSNAQTPGVIVEGFPNTVLDPNGDGYVSLPPSQTPSQFTNIGFPPNILATDINDVLYSEIAYVGIPEITAEPTADLNKGPSCAFTDLVQDADSRSSYYNKDDVNPATIDGTENMRFRFRLGGAASNSKGYSILIDTDEKFGFTGPNADPDAVPGNPGFEIEIVLRTNFEVNAYNVVDPSNVIELAALPYTTHAIKSLALTTVCDDPDYFYDFYIPFSSIAGIDPTTKLRMVSVTSINPKGIIGNNGTSDVAGVNDSQNNTDTSYEIAIDTQTPTNGDPIVRADCPQITGPINDGTGVTVNGTTTLESGNTTTIEVFVDGVSQGTTTTTGTSWSYTIAGAITPGQKITATATVRDSSNTLVKGTSEGNCDTETVADSSCTPPATPVITGIGGSGGKIIQGTSGFTSGTAIIVRIFNNETELTTWGSINKGTNGFTTTAGTGGAWSFNGGGGFKANSGYYTVIVMLASNTTCQSTASTPFSYCGGNDGSVTSGAITFNSPTSLIVNTSAISGTAQTNSTIRLYRNNVYTGLFDPSDGNTAWSIDISSLTLEVGDVLYVSNLQATAVCTSVSTSRTVIAKSIAPVVTIDGCFDGNATSISGTSSEIGGTIRLYTRVGVGVTTSDSQVGTTPTVDANGNWTVTGLNIPSGNYVAATAQNTGETLSDISNEVLISSKTTFTSLTISSDPITEGDASITGTSTGLPTGSTIQLYLDGDKAFNSSGNELTTTTDGSGNWTFTGLDSPLEILYADAVVTVTATEAGSCESDQSSSKVVICNPPAVPTITAVSSTPICENGIFQVTVLAAQPGLLYQLLDQDNNTVGPSFLGPATAGNKTIDTDPIPFGTTSLKVSASKIFGTCTTVESNAISITVNPSPTITFGPNPSATEDPAAQIVNLTYSATTNSPNEYKIDFDDAAFTDVPYTALPVSPIQITVPAGLTAGVYTATVTIREATNGCEKSYPITITITDTTTPTITLTNPSVSLCSGTTTANFAYSGTSNSPDQYSIDFTDAANLQGFVDISNAALPLSPIQVTVPTVAAGGTYTGVLTVRIASSGKISEEYPITINVEKTNGGLIAGDQIILSGTDVTAFTSTEDATGLGGVTYQWWKSTTSATNGFSPIGGATAATYDEGTVTVTTYYKRIATSVTNMCTAESNVITARVLSLSGTPMITQVYQVGGDVFIEVTNIGTTTIPAGEINLLLFRDKTRVFSGQVPDGVFTFSTNTLTAGQSLLIGTSSAFTNVTNTNGSARTSTNASITNISDGNDIITLSTTTDGTSWDNRYDVVSSIPNKTSFVRIDEVTSTNTDYTASEWVAFIDDTILTYSNQSAAAQDGRHPHAPLISEITGSNTDANTLLGLHRTASTTRTGSAWNNGFPDRSRFVIIDEDYNHDALNTKLSARKLTVNASRKLGITDNLLVVTNDVVLNGEIRLINSTGATGNSKAQFIQTHTSASLITGSGNLLVDQNSTVPSKYRYNYMSSPVKSSAGSSNYIIGSVFKDGSNATSYDGVVGNSQTNIAKDITFLVGLNYDGTFDETNNLPITLADYWMYTFASSSGGRANWTQTRSTGTIENTNGFIFKGPGRPQNYTFLGVPKDGKIQTSIGGSESYLVGNPYASAISVKEFIEDNISSITGTLYFWKHAGENVSSGIDGHFFTGYVGGYATRTIATGVTAKAQNLNGVTGTVDITLEAESTENVTSGEIEGTAILLNSATDSITFNNISRSVDSLRIRYKSTLSKTINLKVNDVFKTAITLPSTSGDFNTEVVSFCVLVGNNITIASNNTDSIIIDYLNLYDMNGEVSCSPTSGDNIFQEPEAFIPIGQGFFVAGDTDGGDIIFDNSQREYVTEDGGSVFFREAKKSSNFQGIPILKIGMDHKGDNNISLHRQLAVSFGPFQSFSYDKGYDAEMFDVGETDIYWKFPNDDKKYVIAGVQSIYNDLEVPLEININYSGEITIVVDEIKNYSGDLFIFDKVSGTSHNIKNGKATISLEKGKYTDRFFLSFKPSNTLSVDDVIINSTTKIYTDNKNKLLVISKNEDIFIKKVQLYSILGRKISHWIIKEQEDKKQLKIQRELPTGVYIVKLNTNKGEISRKVVIE
ncbi:T9SS type A sorting domain-containing protein [uncultured Polaribacter sp.]|uniref:T9SS type A sorting domain-containing protein n=1 Tax=uncultured Polaribacter sp. TaxID=174711 RepID=UPI00259AFED6|nr:T9SS type A sorting domain-containing protein [uncultured Polaribacter sp.]